MYLEIAQGMHAITQHAVSSAVAKMAEKSTEDQPPEQVPSEDDSDGDSQPTGKYYKHASSFVLMLNT